MDREPIMEMLREYGVNSEMDLLEAMRNLKPLNIAVFVTPLPKKNISMAPAKVDDTSKRKDNENGQVSERACV